VPVPPALASWIGRAVRLHGGSIKAANASDGGLVVELRLPIEIPS